MKKNYYFLFSDKKQKKDSFEIASDITVFLFLWLPVVGIGLVMLNSAIDHNDFFVPFVVFLTSSLLWGMLFNACTPLVALFSVILGSLLLLSKKLLITGIQHLINRRA